MSNGSTPSATSPDHPADQPRPEITDAPVTALAVGFAAGIGSALLGIGGGLVMVPGMTGLLRIRPHRAVGTSLAVIIPTAVAALLQYGIASWPGDRFLVVAFLSLGGVFGAVLGARLAAALKGTALKGVFGGFVVLTGVMMILLPSKLHNANALLSAVGWGVQAPLIIAAGVLVGTLSGLLGVGGGLIMVPLLVLGLGYDQKVAQGISLAAIVPVSLSGTRMHIARGNVIWSLVTWMGIGAAIAATITGVQVVQKVENQVLRAMFGVFMLFMGGMMVLGAHRAARRGQVRENS